MQFLLIYSIIWIGIGVFVFRRSNSVSNICGAVPMQLRHTEALIFAWYYFFVVSKPHSILFPGATVFRNNCPNYKWIVRFAWHRQYNLFAKTIVREVHLAVASWPKMDNSTQMKTQKNNNHSAHTSKSVHGFYVIRLNGKYVISGRTSR